MGRRRNVGADHALETVNQGVLRREAERLEAEMTRDIIRGGIVPDHLVDGQVRSSRAVQTVLKMAS